MEELVCVPWAACTGLHLDLSGIKAGPESPGQPLAPHDPAVCKPLARPRYGWLNSPSPGTISGCRRNPAAARPEPELRDRWGSLSKAGGSQAKGQRKTL